MRLGNSISKLLSLASASLSQEAPTLGETALKAAGAIGNELLAVLRAANGFYAFENALHFLPARSSLLSVGIEEWNTESGWRKEYEGLADDCLFFAEDVFGGQFCIVDNGIWSFDPETGERQAMGSSLDAWAREILRDYKVMTGHPVAHAWQMQNGPLPEGMRLVPRIPFVCNGEFNLANLALMDAERGMRARGNLARQIRDLPDGAQISFRIEA